MKTKIRLGKFNKQYNNRIKYNTMKKINNKIKEILNEKLLKSLRYNLQDKNINKTAFNIPLKTIWTKIDNNVNTSIQRQINMDFYNKLYE